MRGWWGDALRGTLAFLVLPNLVFYVASRFFFLDRPLVNFDYAVLGVAWPWLPRWLCMALFAVVFLVDAITATGGMYNISPVAGVVALFRAPFGLLITVILAFAASCALAAGLGAFVHRYLHGISKPVLYATSLAALTALFVILAPARSSVAKLTSDIVTRDRGYRTVPARVPAATDALRADIDVQKDQVALVMVESWGVLADSAAHQQLLDIFHTPELRARYHIRTGVVPFSGGTTSGELRELCGMLTDYLVLNDAIIRDCLPNQLRRRGFSTVALHGYKPEYYSRHKWYPRFFDRILFEDSLALSAKRCGTQFRGICDREVFEAFAREVRGGERQLTYWLSIDAHTPVDVARLGELPLGNCTAPQDFCLVVAFLRDLLEQLAQLAGEPDLPRTRFIIVGDHAPAFVRQERAGRLVRGRVPYVELVPFLGRGGGAHREGER
ncbi:MAG TPA: hypothetical protein VGD27_15670 [Longimicrobiales bacterium]